MENIDPPDSSDRFFEPRALQEELEATRREVDQARSEAQNLEQRLRYLERERDLLRASLRNAQDALSTLTRSRSWRLTRPLRLLTHTTTRNRSRSAPEGQPHLERFHEARLDFLRQRAEALVRKHALPDNSQGRTVDIVVYVRGSLRQTRSCLVSVLAARQRTPFELIVIDDANSDSPLRELLEDLADRGHVTLIKNEAEIGYAASANLGLAVHPSRDVVLLDGTAEPTGDWLDRLAAHARGMTRVATVIPFSNSAGPAGYPRIGNHSGARVPPPDLSAEELDEHFRTANPGIAIPFAGDRGTAVYVTRASLNDIGFFDHIAFGEGHGEHLDFRARAAGRAWTNLLACDVFVRHTPVRLDASQEALRREELERFASIHPEDLEATAAYSTEDPPQPFRLNVDIGRLKAWSENIVLFICSRESRAARAYREGLVRTVGEQAEFLHLGRDPEQNRKLILTRLPRGERLDIAVEWYDERSLVDLLRRVHPNHIHYQDVFHDGDHILQLAQHLGIRYDLSIHDFRDLTRKRERSSSFVEGARRVFVPNSFAAERVLRHYPGASVVFASCGQLEGSPRDPMTDPLPVSGESLRVLTIGTLRVAQGSDVVEAAAIAALHHRLPLEFHVLGEARGPLATFPDSYLHIYNPRDDDDLNRSIRRIDPHVCWFPWREPEIGSLDLGAALHAGLPVIATDVGDVRERLAGRPFSWAIDVLTTPQRWNDLFVGLREGADMTALAVRPEAGNRQPSDFRYAVHYLDGLANADPTA